MLVLMVGLPGTGKSTLCRAVAARHGGAVLDKDIIRAALFEPGRVRYTTEQDDLVQEMMLRAADWMIREDRGLTVFFDGRTFSRSYQILNAIAAAGKMETPWRVIECICSETTALTRLERDAAAGSHPAKNRDRALYERLKVQFEPVTVPKVIVDTDRPLEECVAQVICAL